MPMTPAVLGPNTRLGNFRLGYRPAALTPIRLTRARIIVDGVLARDRVRLSSFQIRDAANDEPNVCNLTFDGDPAPEVGQQVRVTINSDAPRHQFNGAIQTVEVTYEADTTKPVYHAVAVDDLAALDILPFGTWENVSATQVVQELIAQFAPGFTATHVEAGLPAISIILDGSEGWSGALRQIIALIGGYFYLEDLDLHLGLEEWTDAPDPIDEAHRFAYDPPINATVDDSQLRTRVYGKGHGENVLADIGAGETIIPVANADAWFNPLGGRAAVGTQRLTYTGLQAGGAGSFAGPSASPTVAPTLDLVAGAGLGSGPFQYAFTWKTAAGETFPSPIGAVTTLVLAAPTSPPQNVRDNSVYNVQTQVGATYTYGFTFGRTVGGETLLGPTTSHVAVAGTPGFAKAIEMDIPPTTGAGPQTVNIYRSKNGGPFVLLVTFALGFSFTFVDIKPDTWTGAAPPSVSTAIYQQVAVSGIAVGPATVTARNLYRTTNGGSQLKLQSTIANNTATTLVDSTADGSLGADAPTADTSGLPTTVSGRVNAGSTSLLSSGAGVFSTGGGWLLNGEQFIRYTGISGNTLTGIPPTGIGSIRNTIAYGDHLDPAPALVGVAGLTRDVLAGETAHIWIQRDDLDAQAEAAARETSPRRASNGIHEFLFSDQRRNEASLTAICDAHLELFARPIVTVAYTTRDVKTKAGKSIVVDLDTPPIHATLTIQDVTISEVDVAPGTPPKYAVTASSIRFSLEAMIRRLSGLLPAGS